MAVLSQVCRDRRIRTSKELLAYEGRQLELQEFPEAGKAQATQRTRPKAKKP